MVDWVSYSSEAGALDQLGLESIVRGSCGGGGGLTSKPTNNVIKLRALVWANLSRPIGWQLQGAGCLQHGARFPELCSKFLAAPGLCQLVKNYSTQGEFNLHKFALSIIYPQHSYYFLPNNPHKPLNV